MLMYADDTTLYCNVNLNITAEVINGELLKINHDNDNDNDNDNE